MIMLRCSAMKSISRLSTPALVSIVHQVFLKLSSF